MANRFDRSPNFDWKLLPVTVSVRFEPTIFIATTRPPQRPVPVRLVTRSCLTDPAEG
jgi:hypothetical protein